MIFKYMVTYPCELFFAVIRKIIGHRNFKRYFYGINMIHGNAYSNKLISDLIKSNKPFLVARFGDAELKTIVQYHEIKFGLRTDYSDKLKKVMHLNAGFFPVTSENLNIFSETMINSAKLVDVYGVWFNFMEKFIIRNYSRTSKLVKLESLEPYRFINPWSKELIGKKVLVVHPFDESIKAQFINRDKLFENKEVLPNFELITYKAIQSNAGSVTEYENWFDALKKMILDISNIDFDIAIVGCGSYGLPLSSKIKEMGKGVIHLAGATQILFGIRGLRWDSRKDMQKYFNEYWIRPSINEKPKNADKVEGGCYW